MKITPKNYAYLKDSIETVLADYPNVINEYELGQFPRSGQVKDLQRRFCFDLLFGAGVSSWISSNLYGLNDLNDDHIYTALKAICPTLTKRY